MQVDSRQTRVGASPSRHVHALGESEPALARGRRPNFLFIGPDKAGSTWLYTMLAQHPQVCVPPAKDIYFFDRHYERGLGWYLRHFPGADSAVAIGEFSHDYLFSDIACERIARDLPGVRLISIVRNPIDRAFSEYLFILKHGLLPLGTPLRDAVAAHPSIIEGGMYGRHFGRYLRRFGKDSLLFPPFEDLAERPDELLAEICRFIGVDPHFRFRRSGEAALPASRPRARWAAILAKGSALALRRAGFAGLVGRIKQHPTVHRALYRRYDDAERPQINPDDRRWLAQVFKDDVAELERLLGRTCRHWLSS